LPTWHLLHQISVIKIDLRVDSHKAEKWKNCKC
jgi:hypothetical protein